MNPVILTVIVISAVVVTLLLVIPTAVLIFSRYARQQKADSKIMQTWVPLKTTTSDLPRSPFPLVDDDGQEEDSDAKRNARAQQNGHYSESKRKL